MELIFEILIQIFFEFFAPLFAEIFFEFGLRGIYLTTGIKKRVSPFAAAFGYVFLAAVASAVSIYAFPNHFLQSRTLRLMSLIATPIAVGSFMAFRGTQLRKKDKKTIRLDSFAYGFLFAFTFAIIRFCYAK